MLEGKSRKNGKRYTTKKRGDRRDNVNKDGEKDNNRVIELGWKCQFKMRMRRSKEKRRGTECQGESNRDSEKEREYGEEWK